MMMMMLQNVLFKGSMSHLQALYSVIDIFKYACYGSR